MLNGLMGQGVINQLSPDKIRLSVTLDTHPPTPLPLTVLLALASPQNAKAIFAAFDDTRR